MLFSGGQPPKVWEHESRKYGLTLKVEVKLSNDEELNIKFGDESLAKILNAEILTMDEDSITE